MRSKVMLFDVDGVLVQAGGYWAAREASMKFFIDQLSWDIPAPDEEIPPLLESYGVTSEWDMVPISLAIILDAAWKKFPEGVTAHTLEQAFKIVRERKLPPQDIDYLGSIQRFKPFFMLTSVPSEALLEACKGDLNPEVLPNIRNQPFMKELLGYTRDIDQSITFRIFQNIVLGAEAFTATYHRSPEIQIESFLEKYDHSLLQPEVSAILKNGIVQGNLFVGALTARPSLPPKEIRSFNHNYTPEAEMALKMIGVEEMALMSFGRMNYLAEEKGDQADHLLKPSPVQALAALRAALTGEELASLEWAYELAGQAQAGQKLTISLDWLPENIELHVFEDSATGILSVKRAVDILGNYGTQIEWYAWGIASHAEKVTVLRGLGAQIFTDVNPAIRAALSY